MGVILEIEAGPFARQKIPVSFGQSLLIGRAAERAEFAVPHDNEMSGVHFAVDCGPNGCHVIDQKSTNGTYLNGARIRDAMLLANGDEIKSGQTIFVVHVVPDHPLPAISSSPQAIVQPPAVAPGEMHRAATPPVRTPALPPVAPDSPQGPSLPSERAHKVPAMSAPSPAFQDRTGQHPAGAAIPRPPVLVIGSWAFHNIPNGWQIQEGLGIQQVVKDAFPSSIGAMEEPLGPGLTLQHYVDAHIKMLREYLPKPKIDVAVPTAIRGSLETVALEIQYSPKEGPSIFFRRDYVRCGSILGVLTFTTLEKELPSIRPVYDSVLSAISFSGKN